MSFKLLRSIIDAWRERRITRDRFVREYGLAQKALRIEVQKNESCNRARGI